MKTAGQHETGAAAAPPRARAGSAAAAPTRPSPVAEISASAFGIPDEEFTPSVRDALVSLLQRSERLRREVEIANARLDHATRNADFDVLLPILNRRAFIRELDRFTAFAERYGTPSCLFYFDLDKFKTVNDLYGHAAGDFVLGHFANLIAGQIRDTDVLARIGGDEFGVILAYTTMEQAIEKGKSLERAMNETPARWKEQLVRLRVTYGIHKLRAGESADEAIAQADRAMYLRKRTLR